MKLLKVLAVSLCVFFGASTQAADFPTGPVRIITSLPAGSGPDVAARKIADMLSQKWRVPVIVENKPGGGGLVALDYYQNLPANGNNLFYGDLGTMVSTPILWKKTALVDNLRPIAPLYYSPMALITSGETKDYKDMLRQFRAKPQYGSWGVGSTGHIAGAEFADFLEANNATHIPYKEYGQWYAGIATKDLPYSVGSIGSSYQLYKAGKLKYIATLTDKRLASMPDLPTVYEVFGDRIAANKSWLVFFVKKDVPTDIQKKLTADLKEAGRSQAMQDQIAALYSVSMADMSDADFQKMYQADQKAYQRLIKKYNITIN